MHIQSVDPGISTAGERDTQVCVCVCVRAGTVTDYMQGSSPTDEDWILVS